jgi:hypothetical protein
MGVRDHDPAVDDLRLGRRVTIVGGGRDALTIWHLGR